MLEFPLHWKSITPFNFENIFHTDGIAKNIFHTNGTAQAIALRNAQITWRFVESQHHQVLIQNFSTIIIRSILFSTFPHPNSLLKYNEATLLAWQQSNVSSGYKCPPITRSLLDDIEAADAVLSAHRVQETVERSHAHGRPANLLIK